MLFFLLSCIMIFLSSAHLYPSVMMLYIIESSISCSCNTVERKTITRSKLTFNMDPGAITFCIFFSNWDFYNLLVTNTLSSTQFKILPQKHYKNFCKLLNYVTSNRGDWRNEKRKFLSLGRLNYSRSITWKITIIWHKSIQQPVLSKEKLDSKSGIR